MGDKWRFLEFNFGIFLMSTSAVLGRYILASSTLVTLWRCAIGAFCLLCVARVFKDSFFIDWKSHGKILILTSALMAIHWTTYFYSLDYSNVSIALLTLYTFPAMTAIIEPLWYGRRVPRRDIYLAIAVLVAVYIITPVDLAGTKIALAVGLGLISAFCYSMRNVLIIPLASAYSGTTLMMYQLLFMTLLLSPSMFFISIDYSEIQWFAVLFLGVLTTAAAHTLFMRGLSYYTAASASLLASIVPVYAITWGYLVLGEVPTLNTYIGGSIIVGVVVLKALEKRRAPLSK